MYEGGLRVPLIAHWPKGIKAGGTNHALVGLCDLMATFAELSGTKLTPQQAPDSISFAPLVQLFNVTNDPHEDHNLAAKHPERVARMVALLRRQIANGRSTSGPKLANGRPRININPRLPDFVRKQLK